MEDSMANVSNEKLVKTANLLREAIPKMSQLNIPLTPENYHVWYEYTMGSSPELNKAIDRLLKDGTEFTNAVNQELYDTHIYLPPEEAFQESVQKLVTTLFKKITGMTKKTQSFSSSLEKYNDVLKQDPDIDTIASLIVNLIDDTDSVLASNQSMESMLEAMNEEVDMLRNNLQTLNKEAFTDKLTAVPNRRAFDKKIETLLDYYHDEQQGFSLLLIDIDHFKQFNDTHGHMVGDRVLKYVASVMTGGIKGDDMLARYGGEEFVVLLPNTSYEDAIAVGNHIREKVSSNKLVDNNAQKKVLGYVTISIGVAAITAEDNADSIVERADKALYLAKDKGRNKVFGEQDL
jgi:diguanylate cyclase